MISPINFNSKQIYQSFKSRKVETKNATQEDKHSNHVPQRVGAGAMALLSMFAISSCSKQQNTTATSATVPTCLSEEANSLTTINQNETEKPETTEETSQTSTTAKVKTAKSNNNIGISKELVSAIDNRLGDGFCAKVSSVAKKIKCNPNDLLAMMYSESGIDPSLCEYNGAVGLIQFLPSTMEELGVDSYTMQNMSGIEQMDYVEKFFINNKKMFLGSTDAKMDPDMLYSLCFLPAYAKRDVLCEIGSNFYEENSGLDLDKDGAISKDDLEERINLKYKEMCQDFIHC